MWVCLIIAFVFGFGLSSCFVLFYLLSTAVFSFTYVIYLPRYDLLQAFHFTHEHFLCLDNFCYNNCGLHTSILSRRSTATAAREQLAAPAIS